MRRQAGHGIASEAGKPAANTFRPRSPSSPKPSLIRSPAWTRLSWLASVFEIGEKKPFQT